MQPHSQNTRDANIDLIRALSILYIVAFWHLFNYTNFFPQYYNLFTSRLTQITLGVFLFISGYLLGAKKIQNSSDIFIFYARRFLRIYPLYLLAVILFYLLGISDPATSLKSIFLMSAFLKPAPQTLWFVNIIILFYLITPLYLWKKFNLKKTIIITALMIAALLIYDFLTGSPDTRLVLYLPLFVAGLVAANTNSKIKKLPVLLAFILAFPISLLKTDSQMQTELLAIPMVLAGSYLLFLSAKDEKPIKLLKPAIFLSYASYGMYLFHRPIYKILTSIYLPRSGAGQFIYLILICVPAIIFLSYLIQKSYDRLIYGKNR